MPGSPTPSRTYRLAIAGETWSANLGDGIIAECIAHLVAMVRPDVAPVPIDLEGRTGPSTPQHRRFRPVAGAVRVIAEVAGLRGALESARWARRRGRLADLQGRLLDGCDAVIIGGGNLLIDNRLAFPRRLALVA